MFIVVPDLGLEERLIIHVRSEMDDMLDAMKNNMKDEIEENLRKELNTGKFKIVKI